MIDVVSWNGTDLSMQDTDVFRAANILSVQLGSLEYAPTLGIDLKYFLQEGVKFQNDSFKGYLVEVLASRGINVSSVVELVEALSSNYNINLSPVETSTGLIAR